MAERKWSRELIVAALRAWEHRYGKRPTSTDLSRAYAKRQGGERLRRLQEGWEQGPWPALSVVQDHFGTYAAAKEAVWARQSSPSSSKLRRPYWSGMDPQPQIATGRSGTMP
jgi:hypothetical protein